MKGLYNGSYMRAYKILPVSVIRLACLSVKALRRLSWFDWYESHGKNISLTCRHFGISRDTFYLWRKRLNKYHLKTLEDDTKNRRPHHLREMTTDPAILKRIYDIRLADLEKSKYEIREELLREGLKVAHNVIQKVINRHPQLQNIQHKKMIKKHRNYSIARIRAARELREEELGSLIQIDTKYLYILGVRFYLFVAVDCKSRFAFIWAYKTISSLSAADFLLKVIKYFPFNILAINTDNGPEYLLHFHQTCETLSIIHYFNYPQTPRMNGRVERLIQTVEYEFFNWQDDLLPELEEINRRCSIFNDKYNNRRFHQAINYQTPQEYVTNYLNQQKGEVHGMYRS